MRILQINCVYRIGSTGKIVASVGDALRLQGHDVFTCYGIGENHIDDFSKKICCNFEHYANALCSRITGIPYGGLFLSNIRIESVIERFKPEVIHIHLPNASMVNVYSLLKYIAKTGIRTVFTLHAEVFHTAGCEHAYECEKWKDGCHDCAEYRQRVQSIFWDRSRTSYQKMLESVNTFDPNSLIITAVSPWLANRASQSAIFKRYSVVYIPNGVDTSVFHYKKTIGLVQRDDFKKVILFVVPYFSLDYGNVKGGYYLPKIASILPEYKFIVVSSRTAADVASLPFNIQLWGRAKSQDELAQLYSESDLTLLLSRRETFSMVTAESLCCGTPVIGFLSGGPESIALKDYSYFVRQGDLNAMARQINSVRSCNREIVSSLATGEYSQDIMAQRFLNLYQP